MVVDIACNPVGHALGGHDRRRGSKGHPIGFYRIARFAVLLLGKLKLSGRLSEIKRLLFDLLLSL